MSTIVISGGAGFIGSRLVQKLHDRGDRIIVLDLFSPQIHGENYIESSLYKSIKGKCEILQSDVRIREAWESALRDADTVVHLAAETGTGQSMYQVSHYASVNIQGTALLLDILMNSKVTVKKIVIASSRAIYGEGAYICREHGIQLPSGRYDADMRRGVFDPLCPRCRQPMSPCATTEDVILKPNSVYGITKMTQEQLVLLFGRTTGMPTIALRYQNVYGPGQSLKNPYTGILSIFSTVMLNNNDIDIFEDGLETRDFVYIDDAIDATIRAIESKAVICEAINVGSGIPTTVLQVAETLKNKYKSTSRIEISGHYRLGDIRHNFADLSRARSILGYEPKINFDDGINRFAEWVKHQKIAEDNYKKSLLELTQKGLLK